jgi:hypothetical protein
MAITGALCASVRATILFIEQHVLREMMRTPVNFLIYKLASILIQLNGTWVRNVRAVSAEFLFIDFCTAWAGSVGEAGRIVEGGSGQIH